MTPAASTQTFAPASPLPAAIPAPIRSMASQHSAFEARLTLPDSPGALSSAAMSSDAISSSLAPEATLPMPSLGVEPAASFAFQNFPADNGPVAGPYDKYIKPGQVAPHLSVRNKVGLGIKDTISPLSVAGWVAAAAYAHALDNSPNYDSPNNDRSGKAFAQRLGAAAARASSEGIFSDSIMSSVFHQDPRYYKMGPSHSLVRRTAYAATRPIITRTDAGHTTINLSYITGNLAGAFLTQAYYPPVNRGVSQVLQTFGGSIGGGAVGFLSSEFLDGLLQAVHLERRR